MVSPASVRARPRPDLRTIGVPAWSSSFLSCALTVDVERPRRSAALAKPPSSTPRAKLRRTSRSNVTCRRSPKPGQLFPAAGQSFADDATSFGQDIICFSHSGLRLGCAVCRVPRPGAVWVPRGCRARAPFGSKRQGLCEYGGGGETKFRFGASGGNNCDCGCILYFAVPSG